MCFYCTSRVKVTMAAPDDVSGRGILFVMSKIARPDILSEKKYMEWYEDDHIAEIMETSGIHSARRFVEVNKAGDKPYLATYQLEDLAFLRTEEFRNIKVKSDLLPGSGLIYDLADFDVRNDRLVQVSDPTKKGPGHARSLVTHHLETKAESVSDEQVDSWYREEVSVISMDVSFHLLTRVLSQGLPSHDQSQGLPANHAFQACLCQVQRRVARPQGPRAADE